MPTKPPLGQSVVLRSPGGQEVNWWSGSPRVGDRPQGINYRTERGSGFMDGGCTLSRDVRGEYVDLAPLNEVVIVGDDGEIDYEGSLVTAPRSLDQGGHTINPTFIGPIALAQDKPLTEVYCDRRFSTWGDPSLNERIREAIGGADLNGAMTFAQDRGLAVAIPNQAFPAATQRAMLWYEAPEGVTVAKVMYKGTVVTLPAAWTHTIAYSAADDLAAAVSSAPTLDGTLRTHTPASVQGRYVAIYLTSAGTALTPAAGSLVRYDLIGVYGNHGLTTRPNGTDPDALYLTDILVNAFNRAAPQIDTSQVQQNPTLIQHLVTDGQFAHQVGLDLNNFARWEMGVWENKRLQFEDVPLDDYDWEVRIGDPGVTTTLQGVDATNLRNGIEVRFTEAGSGRQRILSPDDHDELRDDSIENPATQWGRTKWGEPLALPQPCTEDMALLAGQAKLGDLNSPTEAGDITIEGHVRDRAGHWQPAKRIRGGDRIIVSDFPNSRPRRVTQTQYDADGYRQTVSVDNTFNSLESWLAFLDAELQAANLA